MLHDPRNLGLFCLVKKNTGKFKNPILDFLLKKRTLTDGKGFLD